MDKIRHWYFITDRNFGDKMTLKPKYITAQGDDEPWVKRICVAPTAAHCFSAIGTFGGYKMYVYQTRSKVYGVKPWDIPDMMLTKEHWRLDPTDFVKVAELIVPDKAMWPYGNRGEGPYSEGAYRSQNNDKRQIRRWLAKTGDARLYKIHDANKPWRIKR